MKLFLISAILLALIFYCVCRKELIEENFQTYTRMPFQEVDTGADPMGFYRLDRYRKPYMWPRKFFSTYPYPHMDNCEEV